MVAWVLIVVLGAAFAAGLWVLVRSGHRWQPPPPESPESREALERLEVLGTERPRLWFPRPRSARRDRDQ